MVRLAVCRRRGNVPISAEKTMKGNYVWFKKDLRLAKTYSKRDLAPRCSAKGRSCLN